MTLLVIFAVAAWGGCFLLAEARLFGCDTTGYLDVPDEEDTFETARYWTWVRDTGVLRFRQKLLQYDFFRELFGCYFCLGSLWVGVPLHLGFRYVWGPLYPLYHPWRLEPALIAGMVAVLVAGSSSYIIEKVLHRLDH